MIMLSDARRKLLDKFATCEAEIVAAYACGLADAIRMGQGETPAVTATLRRIEWRRYLDRTTEGQLLDLLLDLLAESDVRAVCGISAEGQDSGAERE